MTPNLQDHGSKMTNDHSAVMFSDLTAQSEKKYPPFRWQKRLLSRLINGDMPDAVDIPTGLGKTSIMALWLIALGQGAILPRRLVYVVDRRVVVDQATRFAECLKHNMPPDLKEQLGLAKGDLPISTLRGGFADNHDWLEDPSKPAIVIGTIDMIGSRLLFEGYGVSRRMRPYYAGFLGADTLLVLDEAHLCPPFEALLHQIAKDIDGKFGSEAPEHAAPPFRLMSLSATGRAVSMPSEVSHFMMEEEDQTESVVRKRLKAAKRLKLIEISDPQQLSTCIAERAIELGSGTQPFRVLVYCNSRRDAIDIKAKIDKHFKLIRRKKGNDKCSSTGLLVGERRVHERQNLEKWLEDQGFLSGASVKPAVPTFLIATSAGEVGVDIDADNMVCDMVAYERLVQRLGRVNRLGNGCAALVDIFVARPNISSTASKAKRDKHAQALITLRHRRRSMEELPLGDDGRRDASPLALKNLKQNCPAIVEAATSPAPLHPALTRPLLDAWSMTSLKQHGGRPEVAPWLRGWEKDEEPQTTVVWRRYLPQIQNDSEFILPPASVGEFFQDAPIHASEKLEALVHNAISWLVSRAAAVSERSTSHELSMKNSEIAAVIIDRAGEYIDHVTLGSLKSFDLLAKKKLSKADKPKVVNRKSDWERAMSNTYLIVDTRMGGLTDGMLNEESDGEPPSADISEGWRSIHEPSGRPLIRFRIEPLKVVQGDTGNKVFEPPELHDWRHINIFETELDAAGSMKAGLAVFKWPDGSGDGESGAILSTHQLLCEHAQEVAAYAQEFATSLQLPSEEVEAFRLAGGFHDHGKAAQKWQVAMNAPSDGCIYAKTSGGGNLRLLEGYRHEFGSLLKAKGVKLPDGTRDLILHLIASHHGYARPLISAAGCDEGPPSLLETYAGEAAMRFAQLQQKYGPWGLAWREAILRAADQRASREREQKERLGRGSFEVNQHG